MRLFLTITAVSLVALAGAGCGGDDNNSGQSTEASADSATTDTTPATPTESTPTEIEPTETEAKKKPQQGSGSGGTGSGGGSQGSSGSSTGSTGSGGSGGTASSGSSGDQAAVTTAVKQFYTSLGGGEGEQACGLMSDSVRERFTRELAKAQRQNGATCASLANSVSKTYPGQLRNRLSQLKVTTVKIDGDKATVTYTLPGVPGTTVPVVREDGSWKIGVPVGSP